MRQTSGFRIAILVVGFVFFSSPIFALSEKQKYPIFSSSYIAFLFLVQALYFLQQAYTLQEYSISRLTFSQNDLYRSMIYYLYESLKQRLIYIMIQNRELLKHIAEKLGDYYKSTEISPVQFNDYMRDLLTPLPSRIKIGRAHV